MVGELGEECLRIRLEHHLHQLETWSLAARVQALQAKGPVPSSACRPRAADSLSADAVLD